MESHAFLLQMLLILASARALAEAALRLGIPPVIGEIAAGVLLGPSLLGLVEPTPLLEVLAEVGVILLLFEVGLETDGRRLLHAGPRAAAVALVGFLVPLLLGHLVAARLFGLAPITAALVGGTLTATSIGVTVRVLRDLRSQEGREGQIVLGAAVLDDILGVVLLALLYQHAVGGAMSPAAVVRVLAFIGAFFLLAPLAAKLMAELLHRFERRSELPGLIPTAMVSLVLLFGWLAHVLGAPALLGGFAAGLALSRRFFLPFGAALHAALRADPRFSRHVEDEMRPVVRLFTPLFFVVVGLELDLRAVPWGDPTIWGLTAALLAVAVTGKLAAGLFAGGDLRRRLVVGTAMVPRGEVGLVFAELGRVHGLLGADHYAALVLVIAATTLAAPLALRRLLQKVRGGD
ncbi:cation:proton antiporter [Inmirania thermothiophila]|uniref:Transporter (CPA2 family) n=1 Tax=Inmirania thermothiophila TaxID=1750597 RepID=A0A3N1Y0J7_9GAMM|nr:cation:proton antiporter [Inmirania thermothiophila]ROR32365.1 transporter (CPA2 family) [Inmirania thermothiophila]